MKQKRKIERQRTETIQKERERERERETENRVYRDKIDWTLHFFWVLEENVPLFVCVCGYN